MKIPSSAAIGYAFQSISTGSMAALVLCLVGCAKDDDVLQGKVVAMQAALQAKNQALEAAQKENEELQAKLQAKPAHSEDSSGGRAEAPPSPAPSDELIRAKTRINDLEEQLANAKQAATKRIVSEAPPTPAQGMKLDIDALKDKLETDLTNKAKELRASVQRQATGKQIDEISLKSIIYPPEIIKPFHSEISLSVVSEGGQKLRLVFPVTADLGGSWALPGPDEIQKMYQLAIGSAPPGAPPSKNLTAPASPGGASASAAPRMKQVNGNTFQFDWGDPRTAASHVTPGAETSAPASATPVAATPSSAANPAPAIPPTKPTQTTSAPASGAAPSVPAPIMPVQRDIVIRFD